MLKKMWILFVEEVFAETDARWKERNKRTRKWVSFAEARAASAQRPENIEMLKMAEAELARDEGDAGGSPNESA